MTHELEKYDGYEGSPAWGPTCTPIHSGLMTKLAAECHTPAPLLKVMTELRERPEGVYVLLAALGAYEYWGSNRNGDAFPEWSLRGDPPPPDVVAHLESEQFRKHYGPFTVPTGRYGQQTFVTDAKGYILHANTDPLRAVGDVIASAYNEFMHRVELVLFVYEARDPEGVRMIRAGQPTPFSMGAKLPFDVCSICFKPARNRAQYCEHTSKQLNQILPDGRKVFTFNWFPRFFDISRVRTPADRSAWALRKVAALGGETPQAPVRLVPGGLSFTKVAGVMGKTGTMTKETPPTAAKSLGSAPIDPELLAVLRSQVEDDTETAPELRDPALDSACRQEGLGPLLSALALAGVVLRPPELSRLQALSGDKIPERLDTDHVPRRLLILIRRHVPQRSMVEPDFSERRRRSPKPERSKTAAVSYDSDYERYLTCLRSEAERIAQAADRTEVRMGLRPDLLGSSLFKHAGYPVGPETWLPFLVALVPTTAHRSFR